MYVTAHLFIIGIVVCCLVIPTSTSGVFEVVFTRFSNPTGKDWNGDTCDASAWSSSAKKCDTYLQICVASPPPATSSNCPKKFQAADDTNSFSMNIDYKKPFSKLQKHFGTYVAAWDEDFGGDDLIDTFWFDFTNKPLANGIIPSWTTTSVKGRRTSYKSTLYYKYRFYCNIPYYGTACDKYCNYTDSVNNGHYRCAITGDKICLTNWYGPKSNCLKYCHGRNDSSGHYECDANGDKICHQNWYGQNCTVYCKPRDGIDGHHNCSNERFKVCQLNWYGENCTVSKCKPNDGIEGHYNCSLITGDKVCHANWYGQNCTVYCKPRDGVDGHYNCNNEGSKVCHPNWYGKNCTVSKCKPKDGIEGHYNCSLITGDKICHANWYGENCSVNCKPRDTVDGHYNCSIQGSKVCHTNWYGENCTVYCKPRDGVDGHYNCSLEGSKMCHANWYGQNCTKYCESKNNYECDEHGTKYCFLDDEDCELRCQSGYELLQHCGCYCNVSADSLRRK